MTPPLRPLPLAALPALLLGCAIQLESRTPLYRGTTTEATSTKSQNSLSTALAGRFVPSRDRGPFVGAEIEAAMCFDTHDSAPEIPTTRARARSAFRASTCPRGVEVRSGSLLAGFTLLPGKGKVAAPGFEATLEAGLGQPAGPVTLDGAWYHLGAGATLILPFKPTNIEPGYVVAGFGFELVTGFRAGIWAPPARDPTDSAPSLALTLESTFLLGLRVRTFSDLVGVPGYPRPQRSE